MGELGRAVPGQARETTDENEVSSAPVAVAVGRWAVWVVGQSDDGLSIVDPDEGKETLVGRTEESAADVAVGLGSVWILGGEGLLSRYSETGPTPRTTGG